MQHLALPDKLHRDRLSTFETKLGQTEFANFQVNIDADGTIVVQLNGRQINESTTTIDPAKTPKTLDQVFTKGPMNGKKCLAIYELKGDTLKICFGNPD